MAANSVQAKAVLDAVQRLDHPTADAVFAAVRANQPRISLATVYRNLARLVADRDIGAHAVDGQVRYDHHTADHLHLHDTATGRLIDLAIPTAVDTSLRALAATHGMAAPELVIEVRGTLKETTP